MFRKANSGRDAFKFSLRGMTVIASYVAAPAIADDHINQVIDERLAGNIDDRPATTTRVIEDFLVRVFVPGANKAA